MESYPESKSWKRNFRRCINLYLIQLNSGRPLSVKRLLDWAFYTENFIKCVDKLLNHFDEVIISEFWENNFKLKIRKDNKSLITIGFMFGLIEDQVKFF